MSMRRRTFSRHFRCAAGYIDTAAQCNTGIYFPLRNHHIQTISGTHLKIEEIFTPAILFCNSAVSIPISIASPHIADPASNRESTFPYTGQRIIIGHIGTYNMGQTQFHTQYRRTRCNTIVNTASLSRLNHGHTANCNGRNQCDNHFFHVVVFLRSRIIMGNLLRCYRASNSVTNSSASRTQNQTEFELC